MPGRFVAGEAHRVEIASENRRVVSRSRFEREGENRETALRRLAIERDHYSLGLLFVVIIRYYYSACC